MKKSNTPKLDVSGEKLKKNLKEDIDKADALYKELKGKAEEYYEGGKKSVNEAQVNLKAQADHLIQHVKEKPLTSLLIAGGIGFILSSILKK